MDTNENKQAWETPEIVDLDVRKTKSSPVVDAEEDLASYCMPAS